MDARDRSRIEEKLAKLEHELNAALDVARALAGAFEDANMGFTASRMDAGIVHSLEEWIRSAEQISSVAALRRELEERENDDES